MPLPSGDVLPGASMGAAGGQEHSPLPESYVLGPGEVEFGLTFSTCLSLVALTMAFTEVLIDGTLSLPMVGIF